MLFRQELNMLLLFHDNACINFSSMSSFSNLYFHLGNKFQIFNYACNSQEYIR